MSKPNFVRIASGQFLTEMVDDINRRVLKDIPSEAYEGWRESQLEEAILDLAKVLEDMYNTGIQVGIREAYKRTDSCLSN